MRKKYITKIILGIFLMAVFFHFDRLGVSAQSGSVRSFGIEASTEAGDFTYHIKWWQKLEAEENEYYITIPYSIQNKMIKVDFVSDGIVYLNGKKIENGMELDALPEGDNTITCSGKQYRLFVIYGSDIPTLHITTQSGSMENVYEDKSYKEPGYAVILQNDEIVCEGELEYIKGRGNSSWSKDKKPFNFKFINKVNLFGMGKSRKWTLLANQSDNTLLKNKLGYDFAETVGIEYNSQSILVDLYIDNEYIGNYTLCERVEIDDNRVDITDLEKLNETANPDINIEEVELDGLRDKESVSVFGGYKWAELPEIPEVITGGYLLEMELESRYHKAVSGFVTDYGQPIILKSPEYASKEQVEYIRNYYQEFENAVLNGDGYNEFGKHYSEYIDIASAAKMYLFQEFSKNLDGGGTSLFFYKDVNGKLNASPVWDLDLAFGGAYEREGVRMDDPEGLWITTSHLAGEALAEKYSILSLLCRHNDFREEAQRQWEEYFAPNISELVSNIDSLYEQNQASIISDKCKWSASGDYSKVSEKVESDIDTLRSFIEKRSVFMSEIFSDERCCIEYNSNGGTGQLYDLEFYEIGTTLQLQENIYTNGEKRFLGWNTKASGWGESYSDCSEITLEKDVTLYAQWEKTTFQEKAASFLLGIIGK